MQQIQRFGVGLSLVLLASCATKLELPAPPQACTQALKSSFKPDALTTVVSVRAIAKGDQLMAVDSPSPVTAAQDLCLVKLLVGPGVTAENIPEAPSFSQGIGIEIWLPTHDNWNQRIRDYGGGGWVGGGHRFADKIGSKVPAIVNANMGFAVGTTDAGQPHYQDGSFLFLSNGKVNFEGLRDFSSRALVETARKTQALVKHYYAKSHAYAYFDGHSQGGRQALKLAQDNPELYNGFMVGQPAVSVNQFGLLGMYTQLVLKHDLGFTALDKEKASAFARKAEAANRRAVAACDSASIGFLLDPMMCKYDPTKDLAALCGAARADAATCLSPQEALALKKIWRGPTRDGSSASEASDASRQGLSLDQDQLWWPFTIGTAIAGKITGAGADQLALAMQDLRYASDARAAGGFVINNATVKPESKWAELSYAELVEAHRRLVAMQPELNHLMTDNADLSKLRARGGKILMHNGWADDAIPPTGAVYYYENVAKTLAGASREQRIANAQTFFRMTMIPGMAHSSQGRAYTVNGKNDAVPMPSLPGNANQNPSREQDPLFSALQDWVEKGEAPGEIMITSKDKTLSYPMCIYPSKITWASGFLSCRAS